MPTDVNNESDYPEEEPFLEQETEEEVEEEEIEEPRRPALVINVYSWATPVLAVLMLVLGLLGGYFGRDYLEQYLPSAKVEGEAGGSSVASQPTPSGPDAETRKQMMDFLTGQVRHYKGSPDATVTLIEFSDFQ